MTKLPFDDGLRAGVRVYVRRVVLLIVFVVALNVLLYGGVFLLHLFLPA